MGFDVSEVFEDLIFLESLVFEHDSIAFEFDLIDEVLF